MQSTRADLNSLTNFCCNWFVSSVSCESVTPDEHSSSNLIADDPQKRSRGLRVEHYIRPPVVINVDLCVPVTVSCILICPDLSRQAEMRVELSGSGGAAPCRLLCPGALVGTSGSLLVARSKHFRADIKTQEIVALPNLPNMVVHNSYGCKDLNGFVHCESSLKNVNVLKHLRHLQLKVINWTGPKPVSIKWLEIWGVVSNACSREELALFRSRFKASMHSPRNQCGQPPGMFTDRDSSVGNGSPIQSNLPSSPSNAGTNAGTSEAGVIEPGGDLGKTPADVTSSVKHSGEIPEHFLDELTFEVMVLPMVLPSGHCVDKSTLDRLALSDAAYGRSPTDPFTGIPFTEVCKPEFCAQLKAQLDQYLLTGHSKTCHSSLAGGRTLGSSAEIQKHLLKTSKTHVCNCEGSLSPASKRVKLHEDWPADCCADRGIESELPASAPSCASTQGGDHSSATSVPHNTIPKHASSFDLQVGNSLELALNQLLHNRN